MQHGDYLSVLEDGLLVNVLLLARVLDVGLHPTNVLTPTKPPLLQTLGGGDGQEETCGEQI